MLKLTLDEFYKKYLGYLNVAGGYLEDRQFPLLLQYCRLRPISSHYTTLSKSPTLERRWADEYGNILLIGKNKRTKILFGDLLIEHRKVFNTDLFSNVSLQDLYKISRLMYCCRGVDDTTEQEVFILSFLGNDNYFRTRVYDGSWDLNVSTLILGQYLIRMVIEQNDIRYFTELSAEKFRPLYPLKDVRHWVTCLPAHHRFKNELSEFESMKQIIGLNSQELI